MQQREKILLIAACGAVMVWMGIPVVQRIFVTPIHERQATLTALGEEIVEKTAEIVRIKQAGASLKRWRERSLPPVPLDAQRLYQAWLTDLAQLAGFNDLRVTPGRRIERASVYTGSLVALEGKATLAQLGDFLRKFYQTDLLHRIVSLNVDSPIDTGDPKLEFALVAEGVSLAGTPPREHLFPQTILKTEFRSSTEQQTIVVDGASPFPTGREFRVRLGEEFLQVVQSKGPEWTVLGGRDGSRSTAHETGAVVELAQVRPDGEMHSDESLRQLVENSPFVKPKPEAVVRAPRPVRKPQPVDRSAEETYLAASITKDGEPQAWLYRNGTRHTILRRDSTIVVGDIEAKVEDIQPDYLVFAMDKKLWRLRIGRNLKSLEEISTSGNRPDQAPSPSAP
jgi:hypothetical protein